MNQLRDKPVGDIAELIIFEHFPEIRKKYWNEAKNLLFEAVDKKEYGFARKILDSVYQKAFEAYQKLIQIKRNEDVIGRENSLEQLDECINVRTSQLEELCECGILILNKQLDYLHETQLNPKEEN